MLEAVDHLKQANLDTTVGGSERCAIVKTETQIKTEQEDAEFTGVREQVNPSLLKVNVVIGETDPMPLLEAVGFLDSEIGSEKDASTPCSDPIQDNGSLIIGGTDPMPLLEVVGFLHSEIKSETDAPTASDPIVSVSFLNANVVSSSMAFGSGEADVGETGSITVASGNTHQQAGSTAVASTSIKTRVIMPLRSKRVSKGLCDQAMTNPDSSLGIRSKGMGDSTAAEVTRKRKAKDSSSNKKRKKTESFEGRCKQLIDFIDEFGHCNVPRGHSVDPLLGQWCSTMRCSCNQIQQGQTPKRNLAQDQIERLEEIGFKWKTSETFEQRCHDLEAFKSKFGHCNVPYQYSLDPSLGKWCSKMRCAYNHRQQGQTPKGNLTQDQIARLEEIGFKWKIQDTFEQHCCFKDSLLLIVLTFVYRINIILYNNNTMIAY